MRDGYCKNNGDNWITRYLIVVMMMMIDRVNKAIYKRKNVNNVINKSLIDNGLIYNGSILICKSFN